MRRRALRLIGRVGLIGPTLVVLAAHAHALSPAEKERRGREAARPAARMVPAPGDAVPSDPVAAAFALFPASGGERREETASDADAATAETVPAPVAVVRVDADVVEVARRDAPQLVLSAYAPVEPTATPIDAVLRGEVATTVEPLGSRPFDVPVPRRRPSPPPVRLASLTPEPLSDATPVPAPIAGEVAVFGEPKRIPKEALPYLAIIRREAAANKVPLWLALGVGWVESKYDPRLRGTHGVVGLMQVMPSTARFQGYRGSTEKLLEAETNIVWGMKELGWDWAKSGGNPCLAIAKYKGGIATKGIGAAAADYCRRAKIVTGML